MLARGYFNHDAEDQPEHLDCVVLYPFANEPQCTVTIYLTKLRSGAWKAEVCWSSLGPQGSWKSALYGAAIVLGSRIAEILTETTTQQDLEKTFGLKFV